MRTVRLVGFRTPQLEADLRSIAHRNDQVGDAAIECLASLFPDSETTKQLTREVLRRLKTRQVRDFFSVIGNVGDARFIPALSRKLLAGEDDQMFIVSLLGRIADKAPLDAALQSRIWGVMRRAMNHNENVRKAVLFTGNGISLCNTSGIIPSLTRIVSTKQGGAHLAYYRLKDCVRPAQLKGWSAVHKVKLKTALTSEATSVTGNMTRSATINDHDRRAAWEMCLAAGMSDLDDWLAAALVETSGIFEVSDALTFSSFFRLNVWPEKAEKLVLEQYQLEAHHGNLIADRRAGLKCFFAFANFDALRVILSAGITSQSTPLRSTTQIAAHLAAWLAQLDADRVVEELLAVCESRDSDSRRMSAIAGLESLADGNLIPSGAVPRLAIVAQDSSLPCYAVAAAIWATSCHMEAALLPEYVNFLYRNIADRDCDMQVRFQSFQSLVRLEIWHNQEKEFVEALDLVNDGPNLPSKAEGYQLWQALLLTQLAIRESSRYLFAVIEVVTKAGTDAVHGVLQICTRTHKVLGIEWEALLDACINRVLRVFNTTYAEGQFLTFIATLAPSAFALAKWEQAWGDWRPEARAALALAIEWNSTKFSPEVKPRLLDLLEMLLSDSAYQVRRNAARAYSKIDISRFSELCQHWSECGNSGLRRRAVEIAVYLPPDQLPTLDNEFLRILSRDPEKSIRDAAITGMSELRNRFWANEILNLIRKGRERAPNEWVAESYCYGRALAEIGDDETLDALRELISDAAVPPNVRNWLQSIEAALDERWKGVMRNWPEPALVWAGALEEVNAPFSLDNRHVSSRLLLWRLGPTSPSDILSWGGSFFEAAPVQSLQYLFGPGVTPRSLKIEGRESAQIWIGGVGTVGLVSFVGNGPYPDPSPHQ